jgi:hypothetical protein
LKKIIRYPIPKRMNNPITSEEEKKKSKYGNKKVVIDGIKFDSQKEGKRYLELKQKERLGLIFDLKLQVKFELIPKYTLNGKTIRAMNYIADFVYRETIKNEEGTRELKYKTIVEDTKGYRTEVYKLKKKMFEYKYGIEIKEV